MAEKITLAEIDINMEKALSDAVELKKRSEQLKNELKDLKESVGDTSAEYVQLSAEYKSVNTQLRSHENMLAKVIETEDSQAGSLDQLRAKLSVVSKEWSKLSESERLNSVRGKELTKQKLALTNQLKAEELATGDARRNVGNYSSALQGLSGSLGNVVSKGEGFIRTIKGFGVIGTVIAGVIAALSAPLIAFFKKSEDGAEMLERKFAGLKASFSVLLGEFIRGGREMTDTFDDLGKSTFWEKFMKIATWMPGSIGKDYLIALGKGMDEANNKAQEWMKTQQELEDLERSMIVPRAEANKKIAEAKLLYEDETLSMEKRIDALKTSLSLEVATLQDELNYQGKVVENIKAINQLKKVTGQLRDEDLLKQQEAEAKLIELQTESFTKQRKVMSTIQKAEDEAELERKEIAAQNAIAIMRQEVDAYLAGADEMKARTAQLLQKDIPDLYDEFTAMRAEAIKLNWENQLAILDQSLLGQFEVQKIYLEQQKQAELKNAEQIGASKLLIEKKYAKAERQIEKTKTDAKLALAQGAAADLATIFGESTKAGKAAAVAMTTIETYRAAQGALTGMIESFPGPWGIALGIVAAAAQVAIGIARVKQILAVKTDGSGGGGGDMSTGPSAATAVPGTTSAMVSTNTSVGNGIVSRDTVTTGSETPQREVVTVIDDVVAAQKSETEKTKTSTL